MFAGVLVAVAVFHHHALAVALTGLAAVTGYKLFVAGFKTGEGTAGLLAHLGHEWSLLSNLFLLLTGFAVLARHFQMTRIPDMMPHILPDDWKGGAVLLGLVFVISAFLDNIAAAIIGGAIAKTVFRDRVHVGYLAAIVAASNAGGSGSVVGDTTTTMMWISGVSPLEVFPAYIAAVSALLVFAIPASLQQHRFSPITQDAPPGVKTDAKALLAVVVILASAIAANVSANMSGLEILTHIPVVGLAVWIAIALTSLFAKPDLHEAKDALPGTAFLLSLVLIASMMPVETLPPASPETTLSLGFVSAIFDNIPLTALAIKQGGYDWAFLAYAVGFGGSMMWFGSSAGVALSNNFPEARSVVRWVTAGWHVSVGYVVGFLVMLLLRGWSP